MKRLLFILLLALFLSSCADKNQYRDAVLAEMKKEQDIKDYNIDPEKMTDCVVDLSSKKMAGFFSFDPSRMTAYRHYTTMLTLTQSENPKEMLVALMNNFGSSKALLKARVNYTESIANCIASTIAQLEQPTKEAPLTTDH
jgi:PBP1b-binding outer membrane lipoprotein LpoB